MKVKEEKGVTGVDIVSGLIIFIFASAIIINLYYFIYVRTIEVKVHEVAVRMCNRNIWKDWFSKIWRSNKWKSRTIYRRIKSHVDYSLVNYAQEADLTEDLVKKINITIVYTIGENKITFPISKIKVRE